MHAIVVSTLTLRPRVHDSLRDEAEQKVPNISNSEAKVGPVVTHLEYLETVALEADLAIEVLLLECFKRNLVLAVVAVAVLLFVEVEVVLNGLVGQLDFFVLSRCKFGRQDPEDGKNGQIQDQREKDPCFEAAAKGPGNVARYADEDRNEERIGEVFVAGPFGGEWGVGNGRVLWQTSCQLILPA